MPAAAARRARAAPWRRSGVWRVFGESDAAAWRRCRFERRLACAKEDDKRGQEHAKTLLDDAHPVLRAHAPHVRQKEMVLQAGGERQRDGRLPVGNVPQAAGFEVVQPAAQPPDAVFVEPPTRAQSA